MIITEASITDVPALCQLVNSAYRGNSSRLGWTTEADLLDGTRIDEAELTAYIEQPLSAILKYIDDNGRITGCVYLKKAGSQLYLGMLTVAPELQARGTGKQLLQAAEERALAHGCNSIVMTVITTRHELIDWYKRHGYADTGKKEPFPTGEKFGKPRMPLEFIVLQKSLV